MKKLPIVVSFLAIFLILFTPNVAAIEYKTIYNDCEATLNKESDINQKLLENELNKEELIKQTYGQLKILLSNGVIEDLRFFIATIMSIFTLIFSIFSFILVPFVLLFYYISVSPFYLMSLLANDFSFIIAINMFVEPLLLLLSMPVISFLACTKVFSTYGKTSFSEAYNYALQTVSSYLQQLLITGN